MFSTNQHSLKMAWCEIMIYILSILNRVQFYKTLLIQGPLPIFFLHYYQHPLLDFCGTSSTDKTVIESSRKSYEVNLELRISCQTVSSYMLVILAQCFFKVHQSISFVLFIASQLLWLWIWWNCTIWTIHPEIYNVTPANITYNFISESSFYSSLLYDLQIADHLLSMLH